MSSKWNWCAVSLVMLFILAACGGGRGGFGDADGGDGTNGDMTEDGTLEDMGDMPGDGVDMPPVTMNGCPSETGSRITGIVRLADLHSTPEPSGPSVVVKDPCGREDTDPTKDTCGEGQLLVWLCASPDCSAPGDPVRSQVSADASLKQSSFDSSPFEFCGLDAGQYYVLPVLDHDSSNSISNYDYTMGIKNIADTSVDYPARVSGFQVDVADADVALGESLVPTNPDVSPVVLNYFYYDHPTPAWTPEPAWLFVAATMHPDVSTTGVGIRGIDLAAQTEFDFIDSSDVTDAKSLATPEGTRYEGDLEKIAYHEGVAYLATDDPGLILTVTLGSDGTVVQGNSIDFRSEGMDATDVLHHATIVETMGSTFLVATVRKSGGSPLPHRPRVPLVIVDITNLESANMAFATLFDSNNVPELDRVRLDQVVAHNGVVYAMETGANSDARRNDGLNRLWSFGVSFMGLPINVAITDVGAYNAEGDVPECGSRPAYREAGLWVGNIGGAPHLAVGGLRTVSFFKIAATLERVQIGAGIDATDPRFDDFSVGYSLFRTNPAGDKLFVFGDCKSKYLSVRPEDWSGPGNSTLSRRRIAVLDLTTVDANGLPVIDPSFDDTTTAPDVVREGLTGSNVTLSEERVAGIGLDCRGILWNLYDVWGFQNIAGNTFNSDCVANRVADAVVTDAHIYIIGEGSVAFGTTGLGVASELWVLDLASGLEVLDPSWQWLYDGSAFQNRYGYWGLTLGERGTTEVTKGLFLAQ